MLATIKPAVSVPFESPNPLGLRVIFMEALSKLSPVLFAECLHEISVEWVE